MRQRREFPARSRNSFTRGIDGATKFSAASHKTKGEKEDGRGKKKGRKNISYMPSGLVLDKFRASRRRVLSKDSKKLLTNNKFAEID